MARRHYEADIPTIARIGSAWCSACGHRVTPRPGQSLRSALDTHANSEAHLGADLLGTSYPEPPRRDPDTRPYRVPHRPAPTIDRPTV